MAPDLLEHGTERAPHRPRARAVTLVLAALAVVGLGALAARGPGPQPEPEPRALVDRAHVLSVRETLAGALHVRIGVEGVARGRLEQVAVDLPGSAISLLPVPGRLTDEGTGLLVVDLLPRCPRRSTDCPGRRSPPSSASLRGHHVGRSRSTSTRRVRSRAPCR